MAVDVGAKAPDFTLPNQDRQPVTLSEQVRNGPVVLAFFPAAFSGVCTKEMCTFRDSMAELNKASGTVLGVSTDTFFALKAWGDQQKLTFPLLSDYNKDVIRKYDVVNPDMVGLARHLQARRVRHRPRRDRQASRGARRCAKRAELRQGQEKSRERECLLLREARGWQPRNHESRFTTGYTGTGPANASRSTELAPPAATG